MEAFELNRGSIGSKKAFVSISADVSKSLRKLILSNKILNMRLALAPEAPKSVQPEIVQLSEDEKQSAEGSSDFRDLIFKKLAGLEKKKVVRLQPKLDMSLSTMGHEFCHSEIAMKFRDKFA